MTKKKPAKRIASNGPRLPGQPTKKTVKARARARKQDVSVVSAEDVRETLEGIKRELEHHYPAPESRLGLNLPPLVIDDSIDMVGQQAVEYEQDDPLDGLCLSASGHAQPVDIPVPGEPEISLLKQDFGREPQSIAETFSIQPVDLPVQTMPAYEVPVVTRRELRLNPPNLSPKQQRAKRRLEDGTGWRCLNCYRVLSPKLSGCPFCSTRKARR